MTRRTLLSLIGLILMGCEFHDSPVPTPPEPPDTNLCPQMCSRLELLGCEEGKSYYDADKPGTRGVPNSSCEEFCTKQQRNGVWVNPRCLAKVPTCQDIETWRTMTCK